MPVNPNTAALYMQRPGVSGAPQQRARTVQPAPGVTRTEALYFNNPAMPDAYRQAVLKLAAETPQDILGPPSSPIGELTIGPDIKAPPPLPPEASRTELLYTNNPQAPGAYRDAVLGLPPSQPGVSPSDPVGTRPYERDPETGLATGGQGTGNPWRVIGSSGAIQSGRGTPPNMPVTFGRLLAAPLVKSAANIQAAGNLPGGGGAAMLFGSPTSGSSRVVR